jgi:hypothetical protein
MTKVIGKRSQRETLPHGARKWLLFGTRTRWLYLDNREEPRTVWERHAEVIIAHCAQRHPGFRPKLWWDFTAPEPRRRLGGTGDLIQATYPAIKLHHEFGIPASWGPINNDDPPAFESEATFLQRLDLLLPGELERLGKTAFEPRIVLRVGDRIRVQRASSPRPRPRGYNSLDQFLAGAPQ